MKKIILVLLSLGIIFSQGLGVGFGANASVVDIDGTVTGGTDSKGETGFVFGVNYEMDLFLMFNLRAGFNFSSSKFKVADAGGLTSVENSETQIPILLKVRLFPWVIKPYALGGVTIVNADKADTKDFFGNKGKVKVAGGTYITLGAGVDIDLPIPLIPAMYAEGVFLTGGPDYFKGDGAPQGSVNQIHAIIGIRF